MIVRSLGCAFTGHRWEAISNLPLGGRVKARCDRCGRIAFVFYR